MKRIKVQQASILQNPIARWNMQRLYTADDLGSDGVITLHKRDTGWCVNVRYQSDLSTGQEYDHLSAADALVKARELNQRFDLHFAAQQTLEALITETAQHS